MIFDKVDLSFREGDTAARPTPASSGPESGWGSIFLDSYNSIKLNHELFAKSRSIDEAYDRRIDEIFTATGQRLKNPYSQPRLTGEDGEVFHDGRGRAMREFEQAVADLAVKFPNHSRILRTDNIEFDAAQIRAQAEHREFATWDRAPPGAGKYVPYVAAQLAAGATDPINILTAPFGFGAGVGAREIVKAGLKMAVLNASIEGSVQPFVQTWRKEAGLDHGVSQAAMSVAAAAVLGFGIDAGGRALWRAGRGRLGYEPVIDKGGLVTGYRKPEQSLDDAVEKLPADHVVRRAYDGDNQALREVAEQTGAINNPAVKGALDFQMLNDLRPSKVDGVESWEFESRSLQALRAATDDDEPPPVRLASVVPQQARELDALGFYSKALEAARALRQAKGTPEQMRAQLRSAGVKEAELQAVGLDGFLEGKASVTRDEIVSHIETAKVNVREVKFGGRRDRHYLTREDAGRALAEAFDYHGPVVLKPETSNMSPGFAVHRAERGIFGLKEGARIGRVRHNTMNEHYYPELPADSTTSGPVKWATYSLDPSNPTYRETVLHLPETRVATIDVRLDAINKEISALSAGKDIQQQDLPRFQELRAEAKQLSDERADLKRGNFQSGHWDEPNVIAHARTSIQKDAQGRKVFVVNELQSDWGQKLRDGGVRDDAKIADLRNQLDEAKRAELESARAANRALDDLGVASVERRAGDTDLDIAFGRINVLEDVYARAERSGDSARIGELAGLVGETKEIGRLLFDAGASARRIDAEIATAEGATPGHPLVNKTDQWVDVGLKRMIRQAVEADADQIAIPSGETVKAFGMGGEESGIRYAYDQMYPKNLRNLLRKFDKGAEGRRIDHLFGQRGEKLARSHGFTTFELTPEIKRAVRSEGMTLFSLPQIPDGTPPHVVKLVDELVADPARHEAVIRELSDAKPQSVAEARKVVGEYLARGREAATQRTYLGARTNPDDTEPLLSRAGLSEPNGPEAKAMVDALERDLAPQQKPTTSKELPRGRTAYDAAVAEGRYVHTETADARMAEIRAEVARTVAMLPPDVQLRVQENLIDFGYGRTAQGAWDGYDRIVYVSLAAADPVRVARHETVHALRQSGLMSDAEFDTLYRFAESEGLRAAYKIDENYKELYGKAYGDRGEAFVESLLREETIADMFADYSLNGRRFANAFGAQGRVIDQIMQLIVDFLKAVRDAVGVHGLKDVRDVFEAIESGAMAQRGSKVTLPDGSEIEGFHLFSIRAFHGTPHTFDPEQGAPAGRFKAERIGTGEGAQAYGHGLYFAENEGVARSYRDLLSDTLHGGTARTAMPSTELNIAAMNKEAGKLNEYKASLLAELNDPSLTPIEKRYAQTRLDAANEVEAMDMTPTGKMYEVNINAEPDQFLDWDRPLSAQHPTVRQAIEGDPAFVAPLSDAPDNFMRNAVRDPSTVAALRDAGVVGVRYLDRSSRRVGEGTSNFVIFPGNEHLIEIVAVDGKPVASLAADLADAKHDGTMGKIVEACRL